MACTMGQVTAPTSPSSIYVLTAQPGSTVILSCIENAADVFLGTNSRVTSATGAPLMLSGPTMFTVPITTTPFDIWCCAGTGTHVVGYITYSNT